MIDSTVGDTYRYSREDPPLPGPADAERFWSYVKVGELDECWPWRTLKLATFWWRDSAGQRQHQLAPRFAFRLSRSGIEIPPDKVVGHRCDWRACCNPSCLELVTQQKNSQDMADRGLHPYMKSGLYRYTRRDWWSQGANGPGEANGFARLTENQIAEIRRRYAAGGVRQVDLAKEFGVGQSHVSRIVRAESWAHLPA